MPDTLHGASRPQSPIEVFWAFTSLAMQGFGGVIAVAQRELVDRRQWLSNRDFVELLSSAQVLPGPNVCNLSLMIGDRFFGWRGALAALGGMVTLPLTVMLTLAWLLGEASQLPHAQGLIKGALTGIAAVAAGQIVGTVLKLSSSLKEHELGWPVCLLLCTMAFGMMAWLHWPLLWVLMGLGGLTCLWTYLVLKRQATAGHRA